MDVPPLDGKEDDEERLPLLLVAPPAVVVGLLLPDGARYIDPTARPAARITAITAPIAIFFPLYAIGFTLVNESQSEIIWCYALEWTVAVAF